MTALAIDTDVPEKASSFSMISEYGAAAAAVCYQGALMVVDANGNFAPGTAVTGLVAAGRCGEFVDNTGGAAGDLNVRVKSGIFRFANDGADPIPATQVGEDCFILDDATVSATNGGATQSTAGRVYEVDADGVWVAISYP
ncbi:MAG: hypothetical protein ACTSX8_00115 [Alphaproteobacteria bacterium]